MDNNKTMSKEKIELKSEDIRKTINEIPSALVHWGIAIIIIIFVILISIIVFVPYPYGNGESIFDHFFLGMR